MDLPIEQWKKQFGKIYQIEEFIFRGLTVAEHKTISHQQISTAEVEEQIVFAALLYPKDLQIDDMPAGVISAIAEQITDISGFGNPKVTKQILSEKRADAQSIFVLMKAMIIAAMPSYTEEDLDNIPIPLLIEKTAFAEQVIKVRQAILGVDGEVSLDLIDPEEELQKQQQAAKHHNASKKPGQASYGDPIAQKLRQALS